MIDRIGYLALDEAASSLKPDMASELSDTFQPLDGTLTAFAGLSWTAGKQVPALTGADTLTLYTIGAAAATNILDRQSGDARYLQGNQSITVSGDASGIGTTAITLTLASVNSNTGTWGSATQVAQFTVNAKGLITAVANVTVTPLWSSIGSKPTTLSGFGITDGQPLNANLTTISGLSPANDDIMQRKSGAWANRTLAQFYADQAGAIPAFAATLGSAASNVTGDGTVYTIVFDTETDQGSNFSTSTGKFTAPVTGYYLFSARAVVSGANSTAFTIARLSLVAGGTTFHLQYSGNSQAFPSPASNVYTSLGGSQAVRLTAGQTAEIVLMVDGSTKTISVLNAPYCGFSGFLIA